jgi:cytochrome c oxidase subunit 2
MDCLNGVHLVLHTPASAHGAEVDNLMNITWVLIIVQAITQVLLHYFAFKYRGKKDQKRFILHNKEAI